MSRPTSPRARLTEEAGGRRDAAVSESAAPAIRDACGSSRVSSLIAESRWCLRSDVASSVPGFGAEIAESEGIWGRFCELKNNLLLDQKLPHVKDLAAAFFKEIAKKHVDDEVLPESQGAIKT